jgi:hypothetical protein
MLLPPDEPHPADALAAIGGDVVPVVDGSDTADVDGTDDVASSAPPPQATQSVATDTSSAVIVRRGLRGIAWTPIRR